MYETFDLFLRIYAPLIWWLHGLCGRKIFTSNFHQPGRIFNITTVFEECVCSFTAEDAKMAVKSGVAGIIVSNHGGRQLDGVLASVSGSFGLNKSLKEDSIIWIPCLLAPCQYSKAEARLNALLPMFPATNITELI